MKTSGKMKQILGWILAAVLSFFIVNSLIFVYYNRPAWISRENGATIGIYHPEKTIRYAYEGFGINEVDEHGYVNPKLPLAKAYVLTLGASHTQGKEVMMGERYTSVLNNLLGGREELRVYNMAVDGNYYPSVVKRFEAALQEFPDSCAVIIETGNTDFDTQELEDALQQMAYSEEDTGKSLMQKLSGKEKLLAFLKEAMPLSVLLSYKQLSNIEPGFKGAFLYQEQPVPEADTGSYYEDEEAFRALEQTMKKIRELYDKPVIILYHPEVRLQKDGSLEIIRSSGAEAFAQLCGSNGIIFSDMGRYFEETYKEASVLPYGFANSAPGNGHLNARGHDMVARQLYDELEKAGVVNVWKGGAAS